MVELFWVFCCHSSSCFFYRVSLFLSRCALARINVIYSCTSFTCLHTGDSTAQLLPDQRVSPLRFVGINKHDNAAQCTAHRHANVAQNYPPSSGYFGAHAASFNPPPASYDGNWQSGAYHEPYRAGGYYPTSYAPQYAAAAATPYAPSTVYSPYGSQGAA